MRNPPNHTSRNTTQENQSDARHFVTDMQEPVGIRTDSGVKVKSVPLHQIVPVYFRSEHGAKIAGQDFFGTRKGRKEAGRKIDPATAEVDYVYVPRIEYDDYDWRGFFEEGQDYFARAPGSRIWVRFEDLPYDTRNTLGQKIDTGVACWPKPEGDEALHYDEEH
jgi:hypothetical protein